MLTEDYVSFETAKLLKEKGFEDAKKEIEKQGEQKWSEEDELMLNDILICGERHCYLDTRNITWLRELKDRVKPQIKKEWSEEDSEYLDSIIAKLEVTQDDALLTDNQMEFLKSLKDRVQPQPKQEWNEEDGKIALSIEQVMNCASLLNIVPEKIDKIRTWLKSLKERYVM